MTYREALLTVQGGNRARRPCWQPGWIELGEFQGRMVPYYVNPADVMVHGHMMPAMRVTYTPFRVIRTSPRTGEQFMYPEDEQAKDWEVVK